jgi:hypothetical protein
MNGPIRLRGTVERQPYAPGSKSERLAPVLVTEAGDRYLLRRAGANPYTDPGLDALDGTQVEVSGRIHRDVFLVEELRVVTEWG